MAPSRNLFVLDTSALLAMRRDEPGADEVERLLRKATKGVGSLLVSFMTRMELLYLIRREDGEEAAWEALRLIDSFPVEWVSCEPDILTAAGVLKADGGLSVADSWVAATAVVRAATLIHKDPEFTKLSQISQKFLH
jgi:ribonuclease VapC